MHHEVTLSFPSNPPASKVAVPAAVESIPPKIGRSGCSRRGSWPERLSMARVKPGVWFRMSEPLTKASASQMASDLRNSYRRRLESLRMSGVVVGERWEAEYGSTPDGCVDSLLSDTARNFGLIKPKFRPPNRPRTTLPPWLPGRCAEFRATFRAIPALVAQGIEHWFPKPCAVVRVHSGALLRTR